MKNLLAITLIITSLLISGCTTTNTEENATNTETEANRTESSDATEPETTSSLNYVDYSTPALQRALESDNRVVLFFHAAWCSTCKGAEKDFKSNLGELALNNVTIVKVDYDKELVLRKRYKIVLQHSFVEIDKDAKEIEKWSGGAMATLREKLGLA